MSWNDLIAFFFCRGFGFVHGPGGDELPRPATRTNPRCHPMPRAGRTSFEISERADHLCASKRAASEVPEG